MLMHSNRSGSAHVVVLGSEKGGSGKSATAMHIAVALMKAGQRVATIDLDCGSKALLVTSTTVVPGCLGSDAEPVVGASAHHHRGIVEGRCDH
jgi:nitrogenase subunit NifH